MMNSERVRVEGAEELEKRFRAMLEKEDCLWEDNACNTPIRWILDFFANETESLRRELEEVKEKLELAEAIADDHAVFAGGVKADYLKLKRENERLTADNQDLSKRNETLGLEVERAILKNEELTAEAERTREAYIKEMAEVEDILGRATGNVVTEESKKLIGGEIGSGTFHGYTPTEIAQVVAKHIEKQDADLRLTSWRQRNTMPKRGGR